MVGDVVMNVFVDVSLHCRICPGQGRAFEHPAVAEDDKEIVNQVSLSTSTRHPKHFFVGFGRHGRVISRRTRH